MSHSLVCVQKGKTRTGVSDHGSACTTLMQTKWEKVNKLYLSISWLLSTIINKYKSNDHKAEKHWSKLRMLVHDRVA